MHSNTRYQRRSKILGRVLELYLLYDIKDKTWLSDHLPKLYWEAADIDLLKPCVAFP
jgi:hypothetical protein